MNMRGVADPITLAIIGIIVLGMCLTAIVAAG